MQVIQIFYRELSPCMQQRATTASKFELEEAMSKLLSPWYLEIQTDAMNPEWKQRIITITFKFHKIDNINCSLTCPTIILSQAVRTSATPLTSKVQTVGRHRNICISILMYIYIFINIKQLMCVSKHTSVCLKFAKRMLYRYEQCSRPLLFHYSHELKNIINPTMS